MLAKTYTNYPILSEPYEKNNKTYILIKMKNGNTKEVRWYSVAEYNKLYKENLKDPLSCPNKTSIGFTHDSIYLITGAVEENEDYLRISPARRNRYFDWFFTETPPQDLPSTLSAVKLDWELVQDEDNWVKPEKEVRAIVLSLLNPTTAIEIPSTGNIGDWIELNITVTKSVPVESKYKASTFHVMTDGVNEFTWTTAAKSWEEGSTHHIKAKIKDFTQHNGKPQTILYYTKELN